MCVRATLFIVSYSGVARINYVGSIFIIAHARDAQIIHCLEINECISRPCGNNGHCHDELNGYKCTCIAGYLGINCQTGIAISSFCTNL